MASCEHYQAQLLGYLYDLPEAEEREALRKHLEQCGSCQAALARAERQKLLLAAAAKAEFPAVRFQPPSAGAVVGSERAPTARILFPRRLWLGGAVAASILLLLGCGVPATIWSWQFYVAQRRAQILAAQYEATLAKTVRLRAERSATLARKQQEVVPVQEKIRKLAERLPKKVEELAQAAPEPPLNVVLSGPQTIQPGAVNSYEVTTLNQNNQPVPSQLDVRLVDRDQILFQRNYANYTGEQRVRLPANLPITASSNILMEVVANQNGGRQKEICQELALAAPVYLTYLTIDRPSYHPGETVYFRSSTLDRFSLKPAQENLQLVYTLTKPSGEKATVLTGSSVLLDAKTDSPLLGPDQKPIQGIGAGQFILDSGTPAGDYTLTVSEASHRFAPQQRNFLVRPQQDRQLKAELKFEAKSIPSSVNKLRIDFYPEGGELVAGVANRVYFQARSPLDRAADLKGQLIDQNGRVIVAKVETFHDDQEPAFNQGTGLFAFTPQLGRKYELKIDSPKGIGEKFDLPPAKEDGVALTIPTGVTGPSEPIHAVVCSPQRDRPLLIGASCRGRLMDHRTVLARKGEATKVDLQPAQEIGGVYRVTVFEEPSILARQVAKEERQLLPLAERLVYRRPAERLHLTLKPDKEQYRAGEKVKLSITAENEKKQANPAVLLLAVVDKSVAATADENALRSMPSYFYLTTDLRRPQDLEDADVFLGSQPKAAEALDLLLGTQGWRRFAEQKPEKFQQPLQEGADRLLVTVGQSSQKAAGLGQVKERQKSLVDNDLAKPQKQEAEAQARLAATQSDKAFASRMESLQREMGELQVQQAAAQSRVEALRALIERMESVFLSALAVLFTTIVAALVVIAVRRGLVRGLPGYALAGVCCLLVVGVVVLLREMELGKAKPTAVAERPPLPEDRTKNPAVTFGYKSDHGNGAANEKKAFPSEEQKRRSAAPMLAKDQERQVLRGGIQYSNLQKSENKRQLAAKQPAETQAFANRPKAAPQFNTSGLGHGFQGGLGGGAPAAKPGNEQTGSSAGLGLLGSVPSGPRSGLSDKTYASDVAKSAGQAGKPATPPLLEPLVVREYAHILPAIGPSAVRSDLVDTLYWNPVLVLPNGKAEVSFDLCDAAATYEVFAVGHTLDGRLGAATCTLESRLR
jgi:hypothetical protein